MRNNKPNFFCFLAFSCRILHFISSSGQKEIQSVYRGLIKESCLIPSLFNVYSSFLSNKLIINSSSRLFYADDIVIYSSHKDFKDTSVTNINSALSILSSSLSIMFSKRP